VSGTPIVTLQTYPDDDGAISVTTWLIGGEDAGLVEKLLGEPATHQVYTAKQLETAHKAIGPVPTVYRHGV
jgi:hypothetical protein